MVKTAGQAGDEADDREQRGSSAKGAHQDHVAALRHHHGPAAANDAGAEADETDQQCRTAGAVNDRSTSYVV